MRISTATGVLLPALLALQAATCCALAQQAPPSNIDTAQRIALLESEVRHLRAELARLRGPATDMVPSWSTAGGAYSLLGAWPPRASLPGTHPPLSPLQAQVQWLAPPAVVFVPPWDPVQCPRCLPCR